MTEAAFEEASLTVTQDGTEPGGPVAPPIVQTSLFTFSSYEEMEEAFSGRKPRPIYTRGVNPTVRMFEEKVAALEKTDDAIGTASGMAAISLAVLSIVRPGDRMVCVRHVYPDSFRFFQTTLKRMGVTTDYVDGRDIDAVREKLPGARLLYLESPTSWTFHTLDLERLAGAARAEGVVTIADNSWATPIFQNPIRLGCDLVVHSASKYISGHSDTVAGVVAGPAERIGRIRADLHPYLGAKLSPFEAWLLVRGMRTLGVRMREQERNAMVVARRLAAHPNVTRVYHPGLAEKAAPGLTGSSGLFSFELDDRVDIPAFCNALSLFQLGVSWGGHESLVIPAAVSLVQAGEHNQARFFGVPDRLVRLSIGLESPNYLWSDLDQAIERSQTSCKPDS